MVVKDMEILETPSKPDEQTSQKSFRLEVVGLGSGGLNGITLAAQKS